MPVSALSLKSNGAELCAKYLMACRTMKVFDLQSAYSRIVKTRLRKAGLMPLMIGNMIYTSHAFIISGISITHLTIKKLATDF